MALINLNLIRELKSEATIHKTMVLSTCYNAAGSKTNVDDDIFVVIIKTHRQAKNLYNKLKQLHQVCSNLSQGNFQPYIDVYTECTQDETDSAPFDPFKELKFHFHSGLVEDLPPRIEQYQELFQLSCTLAESRKSRREGLNRFFGDMPRYHQTTNKAGETVMVPESELPAQTVHQLAVQQQIADIEVEYCLDGYNSFYTQATNLIRIHHDGDVQRCASAILSLFSSTH